MVHGCPRAFQKVNFNSMAQPGSIWFTLCKESKAYHWIQFQPILFRLQRRPTYTFMHIFSLICRVARIIRMGKIHKVCQHLSTCRAHRCNPRIKNNAFKETPQQSRQSVCAFWPGPCSAATVSLLSMFQERTCLPCSTPSQQTELIAPFDNWVFSRSTSK